MYDWFYLLVYLSFFLFSDEVVKIDKVLIKSSEILEIKIISMCINEFENYTETEKIDLLKDYVDYLTLWDCQNYDLFRDLENNHIRKRKFLKAVVPYAFDSIDYVKVFKSKNKLKKFQKMAETSWSSFPIFYMSCCVCGALDCFNENLSLKKILWRGSKILLSY